MYISFPVSMMNDLYKTIFWVYGINLLCLMGDLSKCAEASLCQLSFTRLSSNGLAQARCQGTCLRKETGCVLPKDYLTIESKKEDAAVAKPPPKEEP